MKKDEFIDKAKQVAKDLNYIFKDTKIDGFRITEDNIEFMENGTVVFSYTKKEIEDMVGNDQSVADIHEQSLIE